MAPRDEVRHLLRLHRSNDLRAGLDRRQPEETRRVAQEILRVIEERIVALVK